MSSIVVLSTHLFCLLLVAYIFIQSSRLSIFTRKFSSNLALSLSANMMNSGTQNILFRLLQFLNLYSPEEYHTELNMIKRYERQPGCEKETANECAMCLCKIEEGDEIRELRCDHVFHTVCLERCVAGYKHETCPMCRGSLAPPHKWATELLGVFGEEDVVFSNVFSCRSSRRRSTWWLI
ncbi:probable E3 ubiquitin-protein ligase XERICO [Rhododendron vialii]|uniref:probable E3 ubiquitin-protein ligase XERICO n=1 Tax=Rhododendron vialii TaxID=182163 RepID=UPI00265EC9A1|nr:probable E3 ubiquitin-protein ligase XERICO [Rhododendron vialii]